MPKVSISAAKRVREFPNTSLTSKADKLWCNSCHVEIDFAKKSVVEQHVKSAKHIRTHEALIKSLVHQPLINDGKNDRWKSLTEAFTSAGVPINVFDNPLIRKWMDDNVKTGPPLPSVKTLRGLLKDSGRDDKDGSIKLLSNKPVAIMADESIDIKNRKILNVLAKPLEPDAEFKLISSKVILKCNALEVATRIDSVLNEHFIEKRNVRCFISDNTPYMMLAGQKLLALCDNMLHSTCWAHILHLVAEELRASMPEADKFISAMKASLTKAPARRNLLLDVLKELNYDASLPPVPVLTRWTTWVAAADYYWRNFEAMMVFVKRSPIDSASIRQLRDMLDNHGVAQQLERLSKIYQGLKASILWLENDHAPASSVWLNVRAVEELLKYCGLESQKLKQYFQDKHPAINFWKDVQCLDPRKAADFFPEDHLPATLAKFLDEPIPLVEILKYKIIVKEGIFSSSLRAPFDFWTNRRDEMPKLSKLALAALSVPGSSAAVERSFSVLKRVFSALRCSLTEDNLETHLKIAFNKKSHQSHDEIDLDYDTY